MPKQKNSTVRDLLEIAGYGALLIGSLAVIFLVWCSPSPTQQCYQRNFKAIEDRAGQGNPVPTGAFESIRRNCDRNSNYNI